MQYLPMGYCCQRILAGPSRQGLSEIGLGGLAQCGLRIFIKCPLAHYRWTWAQGREPYA